MSLSQNAPIPPTPPVPKDILEKVTGCKIVSYTVVDGSKLGDNYTSILYSVSAVVIPPGSSDDEGETRHYLLKCYPIHPARQTFLNKMNMFHNELSFFQVWAKELVDFQRKCGNSAKPFLLPFPPCVGGEVVNFTNCEPEVLAKPCKPLDMFIMMIDLRKTWGFKMPDRQQGLGREHSNLVFHELATIHALSWAYKKNVEWDVVKKFPCLQMNIDQEYKDLYWKILDGNAKTAYKALDAVKGEENCNLTQATKEFHKNSMKVIEFYMSQREEDEKSFWNLHRNPPKEMVEATSEDEPWRVICHGDCWCNNMLFKNNDETGKPERVIFVDFQLTRQGCPTFDLVYYVYTSTDAEFRKAHLEEGLQLYHDRFIEVCTTLNTEPLPGFSLESLKRRFHRSKLLGYMMAVLALPIMLNESKTEELNFDGLGDETSLDDMFLDAFSKGAGSPTYQKRMMEVAQEFYDQGVI